MLFYTRRNKYCLQYFISGWCNITNEKAQILPVFMYTLEMFRKLLKISLKHYNWLPQRSAVVVTYFFTSLH